VAVTVIVVELLVGQMWLFHGAQFEVLESIVDEGFDYRVSRSGSILGHGCYFSVSRCVFSPDAPFVVTLWKGSRFCVPCMSAACTPSRFQAIHPMYANSLYTLAVMPQGNCNLVGFGYSLCGYSRQPQGNRNMMLKFTFGDPFAGTCARFKWPFAVPCGIACIQHRRTSHRCTVHLPEIHTWLSTRRLGVRFLLYTLFL
jgi:hypothetical protein